MDKKLIAGIVVLVLVIAAFAYFSWTGADAKDKVIPIGLQLMSVAFNGAAVRYQQSLGQNFAALEPHPWNSSSCERIKAVWYSSNLSERLGDEQDWLDCFAGITAYTNFSNAQLEQCRQAASAVHTMYSKTVRTPDVVIGFYVTLPQNMREGIADLPQNMEAVASAQVLSCLRAGG